MQLRTLTKVIHQVCLFVASPSTLKYLQVLANMVVQIHCLHGVLKWSLLDNVDFLKEIKELSFLHQVIPLPRF